MRFLWNFWGFETQWTLLNVWRSYGGRSQENIHLSLSEVDKKAIQITINQLLETVELTLENDKFAEDESVWSSEGIDDYFK